ncbi:regulatory protein, luxR family [Gillisia sp. Hel1_33_143]|uniref:LuxR C-terminal-related transcriptional regulator n=1 Tax=Gillisia sp. Hel1_33_143 TaxID=1336796 RepID=UPI00087965E4|nr:LuxR C-terminal-related transcriptional regulator [Gillisia sp. Hel1_33_143]SDS13777.1 regulatory protein, luxR family [Gillisia sp. Hel1_33_143]
MNNKSTTSLQHSQHLIAGLLPGDSNIEFFGCWDTLEVKFTQNGSTHNFNELSPEDTRTLMNAYNSNLDARTVLSTYKEDGKIVSRARQLELYTYFMYGGTDNHADMIDGVLQEPENYRHTRNCISLKFKTIKLNGNPLKNREIFMLDEMLEDHKNLVIAMKMKIAESTYNQHDAELKQKAGVHSKHGLLVRAWQEGVGQYFNRV